ncbi:MAG: replicative DNA helicase [Treponemataceae bacterium]|nr:MAG: replicative DNA helicase [Treponemataceae bacterium]
MNALPLKDKIPPHNPDAEQAVLGAMLLDWDSIGKITYFFTPEVFFSKRNAVIYKAILSLYEKGQTGDMITLKDELVSAGKLEAAGGIVYLTELTNAVPTSANIEYYANIVVDCYRRRELIRISSTIVAESHDETKSSLDVLENAQKEILGLSDIRYTQTVKSISEVMFNSFEIIVTRSQNHNAYTGIATGFDELDNLTSGFQNSDLIIIGARPGVGKTSLALSMIQHISIRNRIPAAFFSLEMPHQQIGMRLIAQEARLDSGKLRSGFLRDVDMAKIQDAAGKCYDAPLWISDSPSKMINIRTTTRRMVKDYGIKIIFIDYISLIQSDDSRLPRHEQVAEISRSLKALARELNIPIVALSQLSRDIEKAEHRSRPVLADIRESGSIEQDADAVIFIHPIPQKDKPEEGKKEDEGQETELILAKQRNGPVGIVRVLFFKAFTKYDNMARNPRD